jgi:hypothetical protein
VNAYSHLIGVMQAKLDGEAAPSLLRQFEEHTAAAELNALGHERLPIRRDSELVQSWGFKTIAKSDFAESFYSLLQRDSVDASIQPTCVIPTPFDRWHQEFAMGLEIRLLGWLWGQEL